MCVGVCVCRDVWVCVFTLLGVDMCFRMFSAMMI